MHGKYTSSLRDFAQDYARKLKLKVEEDEISGAEHADDFRSYSGESETCWSIKSYWKRLRPILANDYSFLLILGVMMAVTSFLLDYVIGKCQLAQILLYRMVQFNVVLQYVLWVGFPLLLITFSVGFVHLISPHAIGSGIPEMKVILRGTILRRYLSFQTFVAKTIGLMAALGSGIPIGKEGPFVHISSMCARLLSKFIKGFQSIYVNESRNTDMLACACALGVSSSFASPIGGVLFSIEVTSMYFAVRNYWRGFFTAVCGAFMFRLLAVLDSSEETITALFLTKFRIDFPFDVQEFVAFGFIGLTCGLAGAMFVFTHRKIVDFRHQHKQSSLFRVLEKSRFIYPAIVVIIVSTLSFPKGFGQFMAGQLTAKEAINELFSEKSWSATSLDEATSRIVSHWSNPYTNIYITLVVFIITKFLLTAVCVALPIPAGVFFPVFVIGAAYGRLVGECMATFFPDGIRTTVNATFVVPGGYAVVGAAAMAGAVTHTISTSVIVFELTGQITHILPVMVAVLIANAVVQQLQPSIYDSIIEIKKLPYLPDIQRSRFNLNIGDIMDSKVFYITTKSTYMQLKNLLKKAKLSSFALVDKPESMILLGSIKRPQLEWVLTRQLSKGQTSGRPESDLSTDFGAKDHKISYSVDHERIDVSFPPPQNPRGMPRNEFLDELGGRVGRPPRNPRTVRGQSVNALQRLFVSSTDMSEAASSGDFGEDQTPAWELELLQEQIDFTDCQIDPSPFQLVEQTSLHKAHKLFCLLNLSHAYVTSIGRIVGIVSLNELRQAIENERFFLERRRSRRDSRITSFESDNDSVRSQDGMMSPRPHSESAPPVFGRT